MAIQGILVDSKDEVSNFSRRLKFDEGYLIDEYGNYQVI
jgi:hypothetical protein